MNWKQTIGLIIAVSVIVALCFLVIFPAFYAEKEPDVKKEAMKSETTDAEEEHSVLPKLKGVNWKTPPKKNAEKKPTRKEGEERKPAVVENDTAGLANAETAGEKGPKPLLELQEMSWYEAEGYAVVVGTVKNVSDKSLPSVQAHATFEGEGGWFIAAEHSMIELNPIFPGQVSSFTVISRYYPEITDVVLDFRKFSGETIPWNKAEGFEAETEEQADEAVEETEETEPAVSE